MVKLFHIKKNININFIFGVSVRACYERLGSIVLYFAENLLAECGLSFEDVKVKGHAYKLISRVRSQYKQTCITYGRGVAAASHACRSIYFVVQGK